MIREKDVITMKLPYPNINSKLATNSHMYICRSVNNNKHKFLKCQTLKPYMLKAESNPITSYHDESPDPNRNPFNKKTRIDCDKIFNSLNVCYDLKLLTKSRRDVSDDVFSILLNKINNKAPKDIALNEQDLVNLNSYITFV